MSNEKKLSEQVLSKALYDLELAFPKMSPKFWMLLVVRLKENNFSDEKLERAVKSVIDNHKYPELTIASIINFKQEITGAEW